MAVRYFGIEKGFGLDGVTEDSSSTGKTFEFTVDLADSGSRQDALLAIKALEAYVLKSIWPPA